LHPVADIVFGLAHLLCTMPGGCSGSSDRHLAGFVGHRAGETGGLAGQPLEPVSQTPLYGRCR